MLLQMYLSYILPTLCTPVTLHSFDQMENAEVRSGGVIAVPRFTLDPLMVVVLQLHSNDVNFRVFMALVIYTL